jgi:hypothetical protein
MVMMKFFRRGNFFVFVFSSSFRVYIFFFPDLFYNCHYFQIVCRVASVIEIFQSGKHPLLVPDPKDLLPYVEAVLKKAQHVKTETPPKQTTPIQQSNGSITSSSPQSQQITPTQITSTAMQTNVSLREKISPQYSSQPNSNEQIRTYQQQPQLQLMQTTPIQATRTQLTQTSSNVNNNNNNNNNINHNISPTLPRQATQPGKIKLPPFAFSQTQTQPTSNGNTDPTYVNNN